MFQQINNPLEVVDQPPAVGVEDGQPQVAVPGDGVIPVSKC